MPAIVTERVDGVNIGRITLPAASVSSWEPNEAVLDLINSLNGNSDRSCTIRRSIRFSI